jgi:antitoxin component of MazEF toxin-antitoxin module
VPIEFERKVFTAGGSLRVNLPAPITKALKIEDGDTLIIGLNDHQIMMSKKGNGSS